MNNPIPDPILAYFIHKEIKPEDVSEPEDEIFRVRSIYDEGDFFMTDKGLIQNHRISVTDDNEIECVSLIDPNLDFKVVFEEILE